LNQANVFKSGSGATRLLPRDAAAEELPETHCALQLNTESIMNGWFQTWYAYNNQQGRSQGSPGPPRSKCCFRCLGWLRYA